MFADKSNSPKDDSLHNSQATDADTNASDATNSGESSASTNTLQASDSSSTTNGTEQHAMSTADIDIDDIDLETLERLTNPDATDGDIESVLESVSEHSSHSQDSGAASASADAATSDDASATAVAASSSDESSSLSFTINPLNDSNSDNAAADTNTSADVDASAEDDETVDSGVSVTMNFEDQPRLKVYDENDREIAPPELEPETSTTVDTSATDTETSAEAVDTVEAEAESLASETEVEVEVDAIASEAEAVAEPESVADEVIDESSSNDYADEFVASDEDEAYAEPTDEEAFGVTSDENVEAIIAALDEADAENASAELDDQADDDAEASAYDQAQADAAAAMDAANQAEADALDEEFAALEAEFGISEELEQAVEEEQPSAGIEPTYTNVVYDENVGTYSDDQSEYVMDTISKEAAQSESTDTTGTDSEVVAENAQEPTADADETPMASEAESFDSAATNEDDSFMSDIASALENSELFEREMEEGTIAGSDTVLSVTAASMSDDYKLHPETRSQLAHQDYEVLNPHPAALETAAEAARRFNAQAEAAREEQDEQEYAAAPTTDYQSDDEDFMTDTASLSDGQTNTDRDTNELSVNDTIATEEASSMSDDINAAEPTEADTATTMADATDATVDAADYELNAETDLDTAAEDSDKAAAADSDAIAANAAEDESVAAESVEADTELVADGDDAEASAVSEAEAALADSAEADDDNPFANLESMYADDEDDGIDSALAAQMAAAQASMAASLAEQAAQKASRDAEIQTVSAEAFRSSHKIMSDAQMMSNEGHTAIQGLENRHQVKTSTVEAPDLNKLSEEDRATLDFINRINSSKRARQAMPESPASADPYEIAAQNAAQTAADDSQAIGGTYAVSQHGDDVQRSYEQESINPVSADSFRSAHNIISDAQMMSHEGHTAIQGLENRQTGKEAPRNSTNIMGISDEELEAMRINNERNAQRRKVHAEAEARFNAQMAAEQGLPYDESLLEEPADSSSVVSSTIISGSGAQAASQRVASASEYNAYNNQIQDENQNDIYGSRSDDSLAMDQAPSASNNFNDMYSGVAAPVVKNERDALENPDSIYIKPGSRDALAQDAADEYQNSGFSDGIAVQNADSYNVSDDGAYNERTSDDTGYSPVDNSAYDAGTSEDNLYVSPGVDNHAMEDNSSRNNPYAFREYDENEVQAMPAQRPPVEEDTGPVYYVGRMNEPQEPENTAPSSSDDDIYVGTYADRMAKKREAEEAAKYAQMNAANNASSMDANQGNMAGGSLADETFAAAQNAGGYVTPGAQEPQYYVGPAQTQEPEAAPAYEPSPYITPGVRTPEELAAEAAEREAAARAAEQARLAELARLEQAQRQAEQMRLAEEARRAQMQQMGTSTDAVDDSALAVPAGMGDGGVLSMQNSSSEQYSGDNYNGGPQYFVGEREPSRPMQEAQSEAPIYAVGVGHSNAEVEANIQATRSKLQNDRALPPSYLDNDYAHEIENEEPEQTEEERAYEEALAAAARESMAAPHSKVIENARKLAAEQEARYSQNKSDSQSSSNAANAQDDANAASYMGDHFPGTTASENAAAQQTNSADGSTQNNVFAPESFKSIHSQAQADVAADQGLSPEAYAAANEAAAAAMSSQDASALAAARNSAANESDSDTDHNDERSAEATMRREENGKPNFANMSMKENVGLGMTVFLYLRQLLAAFFTHTNLPILAPKMAAKLGPCYPSSMPIPFFFVGMIAGFIGYFVDSSVHLDSVGSIAFIVFLLLTGLMPYRGIYRICSYLSRRRHDVILVAASVAVPMIIFMWLSKTMIMISDGLAEATAAFAITSMLSAAFASTLTWNLPQDPMDSSGTMTTKGLLFVIVLSVMASFGVMHYITGLSLIALCAAMRLIFGILIAGNNGTSHRAYVHALQLLTMFVLLFDLIVLKSQGYNLLSASTLEFINQFKSVAPAAEATGIIINS